MPQCNFATGHVRLSKPQLFLGNAGISSIMDIAPSSHACAKTPAACSGSRWMERTLSHLEALWEIMVVFFKTRKNRWFKNKGVVSHQVGDIKGALICTLAYSYQCYIRVICYRLSLLIEYMDYISDSVTFNVTHAPVSTAGPRPWNGSSDGEEKIMTNDSRG